MRPSIGVRSSLAVPVVLIPLAVAGIVAPVSAQALGPADATRHLATAKAVDTKCSYLSTTEHQELVDFTARAETATAGTDGVETATKSVSDGRTAGSAMSCNDDSKELVASALGAARQAMAAAIAAEKRQQRRTATAQAQPRQRVAGFGQTRQQRYRTVDQIPEMAPPASIGQYRYETMAYYVELRCRHLSPRDTRRMWEGIAARHKAAVRVFGGDAAMRAQAAAEREARYRGACGYQTAQMVRQAQASLRGY